MAVPTPPAVPSTSSLPQGPPYRALGGDLAVAHRFLLEVDGVQVGVFKAVAGLSAQIETVQLNEGGNNQAKVTLPGRISWGNITLTRGLTDGDYMFQWLQRTSGDGFATQQNKLTKRTAAITAISQDGKRLRAWNFVGVFPVRWKGPDFDVDSTQPLVEELEFAHDGFTVTAPGTSV